MPADGGWKAAGVSVAGPAHVSEGTDCEDAHTITFCSDGHIIAIISDGAGSAVLGGFAAKRTCDVLPPLLQSSLPRATDHLTKRSIATKRRRIIEAVEEARNGLLKAAKEQGNEPDDFLATLVGVVAHPNYGGLVFHVGDGAVVAFDPERGLLLVSRPENGEYLSTTYFLIEKEWKTHLRFSFFPPSCRTILLMSDGVTELALLRNRNGIEPFAPFFEPLCRFLSTCDRAEGEAALEAALSSESAAMRVDDDKTLVWLQAASDA